MSKRINTAITRETDDRDPVDHETIMIRLEPGSKCLTLWTKGRRTKFRIRFADIFRLGIQMEARKVLGELGR